MWKATYRILLGEASKPPLIQGWAVVDNTQDEDWENVQLSLIAGLPVSFTHDLYTPRYIRRPEVKVQETTGVLPPTFPFHTPEMEGQAREQVVLREAAGQEDHDHAVGLRRAGQTPGGAGVLGREGGRALGEQRGGEATEPAEAQQRAAEEGAAAQPVVQ